jgi:predicted dithiol-disulfide oxidoreductase (DUF899 family)
VPIREISIEELFGRSVFYKDENGDIFHTYASYARGGNLMVGTYNILDLMPKSLGRDRFVRTRQ